MYLQKCIIQDIVNECQRFISVVPILITEGWVKNKINAKGSNKQYICGDCPEKKTSLRNKHFAKAVVVGSSVRADEFWKKYDCN